MESFENQFSQPEEAQTGIEQREREKPIDISIGSLVRIKRPSGIIEEDWEVTKIVEVDDNEDPEKTENIVTVIKTSDNVNGRVNYREENIKLEDLVLMQQ